ncbi:peptidoglycan DD-metalloendopeptidase family protein [Chloroflexus sp.]|uniref:peptidoglycan DD-metalloendopeptidase family protein n=1 Tax=Chloroflexus sp. TaxID=1904827 RepID=UPI00260ED251|nr:peptidoglycan DD-metalloendopeptidase family protein [uncultured Chloroflexus sp.]
MARLARHLIVVLARRACNRQVSRVLLCLIQLDRMAFFGYPAGAMRRLLLMLFICLSACAAPSPPSVTPTPMVAVTSAPLPQLVVTATATMTPVPTATPIATVTVVPTATPEPAIHPIFDPQRLSYDHNFSTPEIQAFLAARNSPLATTRINIGRRSHSFVEVLVSLSSLYSVSPRLLLSLMELQSGLLSAESPSNEQLAWAAGFRGDNGSRRGLFAQLRWLTREVRAALRDYALLGPEALPPLIFADGSQMAAPTDLSRYVLSRALAPTTAPARLESLLGAVAPTYQRLFALDPRLAPLDWPPPAEPFLTRPAERNVPVTSFFDHDAPFLRANGSLHTFWGRSETDRAFAYDGHTGWDYAMGPPERVLAAAPGLVVFAGYSDDGCATPAGAVIIDHGNGYRTLYWHLARVSVTTGDEVSRGDVLGIAGDTGCARGAHLHLQVQYLGRDVDPYGWCGSDPDPWAANPVGQISVWLWRDMPSPCAPPPAGVIVVDDDDPQFRATGDWQSIASGYGGGARFAPSFLAASALRPWRLSDFAAPRVAVWQPELPAVGQYRVLAYVPFALNGYDDSREARFLIRHQGGETVITIDLEAERNWWADLGIYTFDPAARPLVATGTVAGDRQRGIWADAIAFVPVTDSATR